jgi:hypothetical protein
MWRSLDQLRYELLEGGAPVVAKILDVVRQ